MLFRFDPVAEHVHGFSQSLENGSEKADEHDLASLVPPEEGCFCYSTYLGKGALEISETGGSNVSWHAWTSSCQ